jgi:hypothetical protein
MTDFASPTTIQAEEPLTASVPSTAGEGISAAPTFVCGLSDTTDLELELDAVIHELGRASERAMAGGDPAGARIYTDRMMAAIRSRSPQHQARLTAEAQRRIDEARTTNGVCYFSSDAAQALGRGLPA